MDIPVRLVLLQAFTGVALGAVYVLVATGLSLIFGMLTVVNFAHGAFFMVGAYAGVLVLGYGGNFWLCLLAVPLAVGLVGMVSERFLVRPLYGRGPDYPLLLTFGLGYVLVELVRIGFGPEGREFGVPEALRGSVQVGIGAFPLYRLFLVLITGAVVVGLWTLIGRTSFGLIIRAGARDPLILRVLGIDVPLVWTAVFGVGAAAAGLAGVLAAPIRGVSPEMGQSVLIEAFVVTVVGGMGSLPGAVLAGLLIGVVSSLTSLWLPEYDTISMFALMALILVVRPRGLAGREGLLG
jgi:branched-chain amino acid transport system permease protein